MLSIKGIFVAFLILGLYSTIVKAGFDLNAGKSLVKGILQTIHSKLDDGINDNATIDAATNLDELISAANGALSTDQRTSLRDLSTNPRKSLLNALNTYNTNFSSQLQSAGIENKTVPLADLLNEIHG